MAVQLNHTIVATRNKELSAHYLADLLGLPQPKPYGPFLVLQTSNDVSLDYLESTGKIRNQHYAFLVSEEEFDAILGRIIERGITYWADPAHRQPGEINTNDGGRGAYFDDPDGHNMEIITRPYGG